MSAQEHAEIVEEVGRELARAGVAGTLVIAGKSIELHAAGAPVAIEIELILGQWPLLPPEMRVRKAEEIARRLIAARRAARDAEQRDPELELASRGRIVGAVAGFFGLLLVIGVVRFAIPRLSDPPKAAPTAPSEEDGARRARLARACDAVRDRIRQGAGFGPLSLEGFVVELWLGEKGGAPLRTHPAIAALVSGGKLAPTADDKLAAVIGGVVEIADGLDAEHAARWEGWNTVTIAFEDGLGRAFFEEDNRPRFIGLADRLATATGATHGALYARCAHQTTHDVGAWFRGPDLPGAAATMMYEMGLFSDEKVFDARGLATIRGGGSELDALRKSTATIDDAIAKLVGTAGGSVTMGPPTTLQFALAAPARSLAATKELARKLGIAPPTAE